jgi:uncharacterized protein (DUF1800 family)
MKHREGSSGRALGAAAALLLTACSGGGAATESGAPAAEAEAGHVLRRLGYGPTPTLLERLAREGVETWIGEQLAPQSVPESPELLALLAQGPAPSSEWDAPTLDQLVKLSYARALFSNRQLVEQMVDFLETHLCTNYNRSFAMTGSPDAAAWFEWRENDFFRAHALGRFEDLLVFSATSPAMLFTLDSATNVAGTPNENYARELLELHTVGVDGGYTQADVEEIARCFTGWSVCQVAPGSEQDPLAPCGGPAGAKLWAFHFDAGQHDSGPKVVFAGTPYELYVPARPGNAGLQDGHDVLLHLAGLEQTARFVSSKLVQRFVADDPPPALVAAATAAWMQSGGELRAVLRKIFDSPQFHAPGQRWSKLETPLESACSTARALGATADRLERLVAMRVHLEGGALGQELFRWITPDGFPERGPDLLATAGLFGRLELHRGLYTGDDFHLAYDPIELLSSRGVELESAGAVVRELARLLYQERFSPEDQRLAVLFLETDENGHPRPLDTDEPDYELRLRQVACLLASLPQGVQQ